jgi:hypothetical protein
MNNNKMKKYVNAYLKIAAESEGHWDEYDNGSAYRLRFVGQTVATICKNKVDKGYTTYLPGGITQQNKTLNGAFQDCRHAVGAWLFVCGKFAERDSAKGDKQ